MRGNSSLSVRHCEFGDKQSSPHHHSSLRGGVPTKQSSQLIRLLFLTGLLRPHGGLAMTMGGNVPCLSEFLERGYKDFFLKFLGKTDFLRGQELTANCALVEILMSLKLCLDF